MMKRLSLVFVLSGWGTAQAGDKPNWDSVAVSYHAFAEPRGDDPVIDGPGLSGSKQVAENLFLFGEWRHASTEETSRRSFDPMTGRELTLSASSTLRHYSLGLGYRFPVAKTTDFFGMLSIDQLEFNQSVNSQSNTRSSDGRTVRVGLRSRLSTPFELSGSLASIWGSWAGPDSDDRLTEMRLSAHFAINPQVSLGLEYRDLITVEALGLSVKYNFQPLGGSNDD